jgi:hypothetical protein
MHPECVSIGKDQPVPVPPPHPPNRIGRQRSGVLFKGDEEANAKEASAPDQERLIRECAPGFQRPTTEGKRCDDLRPIAQFELLFGLDPGEV